MIVPMKRITLAVLAKEKQQALHDLRQAGLVHVTKREGTSTPLLQLEERRTAVTQAIAVLEEHAPKKAGRNTANPKTQQDVIQAVEKIHALRTEKRDLQETVVRDSRDLDRLSGWGHINPADFEYLSQREIHLIPVEMSAKDYSALPETVRTLIVSRDKSTVRCLVWSQSDELPQEMPAGTSVLEFPDRDTRQIESGLETARNRIKAAGNKLASMAGWISSLEELLRETETAIVFEQIHAGMEDLSLSSIDVTSVEKETGKNGHPAPVLDPAQISWLGGYVPAQDLGALASLAKTRGWAMAADDPSEEEEVPTKLKNNRFVNLISPLLDFLGTVPGYREMDISLWFLLFFGIFFAMIFGDAGYGGVLVLLALYGSFSVKRKGKPVPAGLSMLLYLGVTTVLWGTLTGSWFGAPFEKLPAFLRAAALPLIAPSNPAGVDAAAENVKIFCFILALTQLSLAHLIGFFRNIRSLKALGEIGSLAMVIGMFFVVLNLVVDAEKFPMNNLILGMVGGGFLMNFMFINYSRSVGQGILESLKNSISMFLGVVNVFSDIMSYIRLWAVGLAGAAISQTINEMAGPFMGGAVIFAGVLVLFFGHGLNYVMGVLSVIVHGVRLNTLEFSNHLGLTWSGFKYEPFSETAEK